MDNSTAKSIVEFLDKYVDSLVSNSFDELFSIEHSYYLGAFLYDELGIKFWNYMSYIPKYMLCDSEKLEDIKLPSIITKIAWSAFSDCKSLQSIVIPDGVTIIDGNAFIRCTSLESISIPSSVNKMGESTFNNCPNLTIKAPKDSYAIQYAKEHNITYVEL